ncbi:MAG: DNA-binding transcriptional ArsR family regulator [Neolewinella sp.]|jgi:DNA-binding transcriptional ArsR family regulator
MFVTNQLQINVRRDVFQAISDPIRRDIIDMLTKEVLTVNEVADKFDISRPAVSKHLKILDECGLLTINKKGRERYCAVDPESLIPAFLWIEQYHQQWRARIDAFADFVNESTTKSESNDQSE